MGLSHPNRIRPLYSALLDVGDETAAVGQYGNRDNAVAFGEAEHAAGRAVLRGPCHDRPGVYRTDTPLAPTVTRTAPSGLVAASLICSTCAWTDWYR